VETNIFNYMEKKHLLIGIDDTDDNCSKGTGYFSRKLGCYLEENMLGRVLGISRHQLCTNNRINYTTNNSSACIEICICVEASKLIEGIRNYTKEHTSKKANPGFCVIDMTNVPKSLLDFGLKSKTKIVSVNEAYKIAAEHNIHLEGIKQGASGIIGALAAVGLRATGNDGRMIWVQGREISEMQGVFVAGEIYSTTRVDSIKTLEGFKIPVNATIELNKSARPVIKENTITLFVEECNEKEVAEWRVISEKAIKNISD